MATAAAPLESIGGKAPPVRWVVIAVFNLGMVIHYMSRSALAVPLAVPEFIRAFHLSGTGRGVVNSAFFWTYALLQVPGGWLVDRYGVKFPYFLGFSIWSLACLSMGLIQSISQLILLQIVLGVGLSVVTPATFRWIRYHFLEKERGLAIGVYMTGTKIGPAIGAPVAAWLMALYDWRLIFVLIGIVGLVLLAPWLWLVKDNDRKLEPDFAESPAADAVPFSQIMASPVAWGTIAAAFCYMYSVFFCLTWMPAYFIEKRHLSLGRMGLFTFLSFGGMTVVAMLGGWAADVLIGRGRNPVTVRKWFTIAGFALGCTELLGVRATSLNSALVFAVVSLSGLGLATANYWAITHSLIPGEAIGRITAVQNSACSVAGIVAPIFTGWLLQKTGTYNAPMLAVLVVLVVGVLSYLLLIREKYAPRRGAYTGQNLAPRRLS